MLTLILALLAQSPAAQPATGTLQGIVVKAGTLEALSRATVEIRGDDTRSAPIATTTTEADGRFLFRNLRPGRYGVVVTRPGYVRRAMTATIVAGQEAPGVQVALTATGAIYGRIFGADGAGIGNVEVAALTSRFQNGRRTFSAVQTARSNDRGEYRLFWLSPGRYYIRATHRDAQSEMIGMPARSVGGFQIMGGSTQTGTYAVRGSGDQSFVDLYGPGGQNPDGSEYVPVYFPATFDEQAAIAIDIRAGSEQGSVDVPVTPVRARHVRGAVINGATGQVAEYAGIREVPADPFARMGRVGMANSAPAPNNPDGSFDLELLPGRHTLMGTAGSGVGYVTVEVGDTDIDGLNIVATPTFSVRGRLVTDGAPVPAADLENLRISLVRNLTVLPPPSSYSLPLPDGSFSLSATAGDFWISLAPLLNLGPLPPFLTRPRSLEHAYVKSVSLGNVDVLNSGVRLEGPPGSPMEIVIGMNPGALEGVVAEDAQPAAGATVVLLPDVRRRYDLYKTTTTDPAGRFRLDRIAAGDYTLFAFEDVSEGAWEDPDFIRQHEARGTSIRIVDGSNQIVRLTTIPAQ